MHLIKVLLRANDEDIFHGFLSLGGEAVEFDSLEAARSAREMVLNHEDTFDLFEPWDSVEETRPKIARVEIWEMLLVE